MYATTSERRVLTSCSHRTICRWLVVVAAKHKERLMGYPNTYLEWKPLYFVGISVWRRYDYNVHLVFHGISSNILGLYNKSLNAMFINV